MAVILGINNNGTSQLGNEQLAVIRNNKVAVLQGSFIIEVYVSSVRTSACGRYKADGCCTGVAVKRGSTVILLVQKYGQ